jgi:hypothetical protein
MVTPTHSPSQLQGASRTTGGILRGRADGNVFNWADGPDFPPVKEVPVGGKVHVYTSHVNPMTETPQMSLTHEVTSSLTSILSNLAELFSPIRSKLLNSAF